MLLVILALLAPNFHPGAKPFAALPACSALSEGTFLRIGDGSSLAVGQVAAGEGSLDEIVQCSGGQWIVRAVVTHGGMRR